MKEVIIAIFASGAFFTFVQFLIMRYDTKKALEKRLDSIDERMDRNKAIEARNRILRFADELSNEVVHCEDYFKQMMLDCDVYDHYCDNHPNFSNGLTVIAKEYIKDEYKKMFTHGGKEQ